MVVSNIEIPETTMQKTVTLSHYEQRQSNHLQRFGRIRQNLHTYRTLPDQFVQIEIQLQEDSGGNFYK
jgi:hypothetical protein